MPIFSDEKGVLSTVRVVNFATEKELQNLIEANLQEVFGCRFVATEFSTGSIHSGRIDSLALSEDGNPVIIEYKKTEDSKLINQALFYLDWIKDHKGDFEIAVRNALGEVKINWEHIRVICLAPSYDRYSLHAVKHMGAGLELWQYHRYENGILELEEIFRNSDQYSSNSISAKTVKATKSDAKTKESITFETHLGKAGDAVKPLVQELSDFICGLDASIAEVPQKLYVAYKLAKNVACMEVHRKEVLILLPLKYEANMPNFARDLTGIGHWGTGDLELRISSFEQLEPAFEIILRSFLEHGGS